VEVAVSELIEQLTGLEERLARKQIDLLLAMAKQPGERPLAAEDLSRVSNVHSALEAVKAEIAARHTREGVSF
jgi:hypothetical protein